MLGFTSSLKSSTPALSRCRFPSTFAKYRPLDSLRLRQQRAYAINRFPSSRRPVGSGRKRESSEPTANRRKESSGYEENVASDAYETTPSGQESPLWQRSQNLDSSVSSTDSLHRLLSQDVLVVERQIEMLNIFIGFEQTNKYSIHGVDGTPLGFIAEEPGGFLSSMRRQIFATHRPFRALIMDTEGKPILWIRRPFAWINSRMYVQRPAESRDMSEGGEPVLDTFAEVQQIWHPWRRRYDLFLRESPKRILTTVDEPQPEPETSVFSQFAKVDSGFLAWNFSIRDAREEELAFIGRAFRGVAREVFTDTGQYQVSFGPRPDLPEVHQDGTTTMSRGRVVHPDLTLNERALVLALAINIDFDYFSRHSGHHNGFIPFTSTFDE